nr:hypothetical protein [Tanacetum cinerariifolium]
MPSKGVTRNIATIWKSHFTGAWDTWKKVSKEERDVWFNLFKGLQIATSKVDPLSVVPALNGSKNGPVMPSKHCMCKQLGSSTLFRIAQLLMLRVTRWNPSIQVDVRRVFNKIGSKSFSDCMSKARKKAEKPEFMNQATWEALCGVWRLPALVAKYERGKTARQSNKRLHTGGSIPISEHKKKMREELSREPSISELFLRCHQNKKTKVFVNATAKAAWSKSSEPCAQTEFPQTEFPQSYTKSLEPFRALEGYNAVHGVDDTLDAHSGNGAKMFPKWINCVGSKNGTTYEVGDADEYVCQPNIEEPSAHNIPNEAQSKKLDQVVKAQSSSEKQLRKFVVQEVGKLVANEVGKAVAEEVGKETQQILDAIRIRPI